MLPDPWSGVSVLNQGAECCLGFRASSGLSPPHVSESLSLGPEDVIIKDLIDLIPAGSGWDILNIAYDINDSGQIVGYGTVGGETHAFMMTPIPEPTTMLLLALA